MHNPVAAASPPSYPTSRRSYPASLAGSLSAFPTLADAQAAERGFRDYPRALEAGRAYMDGHYAAARAS